MRLFLALCCACGAAATVLPFHGDAVLLQTIASLSRTLPTLSFQEVSTDCGSGGVSARAHAHMAAAFPAVERRCGVADTERGAVVVWVRGEEAAALASADKLLTAAPRGRPTFAVVDWTAAAGDGGGADGLGGHIAHQVGLPQGDTWGLLAAHATSATDALYALWDVSAKVAASTLQASTTLLSNTHDVTLARSTSRLHAKLRASQFPEGNNCQDRRLLVFPWAKEAALHGFSAMFQFLSAALVLAVNIDRTLVEVVAGGAEDDSWPRAPAAACNNQLFNCYFEPLSACGWRSGYVGHLDSLPRLNVAEPAQQKDPVVVMPSLEECHGLLRRVTRAKAVPSWFRPRAAWFPAVQLYLFKPLPGVLGDALVSMATSVAAAPKAGRMASVGVHVRHGDVTAVQYRQTASVEAHVAAAEAVLSSVRPPVVHGVLVVASDNDTARVQAAALAGGQFATLQADAPLIVDPFNAVFHVETVLTSGKLPPSAAHSVTAGVIKDIYLLSHTGRIVGSCMSQVARLAAELAMARGLAQGPPKGFDADACNAFPTHFYTLPVPWEPFSAAALPHPQ